MLKTEGRSLHLGPGLMAITPFVAATVQRFRLAYQGHHPCPNSRFVLHYRHQPVHVRPGG